MADPEQKPADLNDDALRIARGLNLGLPDVQRMERAKANDNRATVEVWR